MCGKIHTTINILQIFLSCATPPGKKIQIYSSLNYLRKVINAGKIFVLSWYDYIYLQNMGYDW
jgi:hypothetical protein